MKTENNFFYLKVIWVKILYYFCLIFLFDLISIRIGCTLKMANHMSCSEKLNQVDAFTESWIATCLSHVHSQPAFTLTSVGFTPI